MNKQFGYWPSRSAGKTHAIVSELATRHMLTFHHALEMACLEALTDSNKGGKHGVLVRWSKDKLSWSVAVSEHVPYGVIYEVDDDWEPQ